MLRRTSTRLAVALAVTFVPLASGCSESDGSAPDGFVRHDGGGYTFVRPEGWRRSAKEKQFIRARDVEFVDPATRSGVPTLVGVDVTDPKHPTLNAYAALIYGADAMGVPEFKVTSRKSVEVKGAREALRIASSYKESAFGTPATVRQWSILARTDDGTVYDLRVGTGDPRFSEKTFNTIAAKFEVRR